MGVCSVGVGVGAPADTIHRRGGHALQLSEGGHGAQGRRGDVQTRRQRVPCKGIQEPITELDDKLLAARTDALWPHHDRDQSLNCRHQLLSLRLTGARHGIGGQLSGEGVVFGTHLEATAEAIPAAIDDWSERLHAANLWSECGLEKTDHKWVLEKGFGRIGAN